MFDDDVFMVQQPLDPELLEEALDILRMHHNGELRFSVNRLSGRPQYVLISRFVREDRSGWYLDLVGVAPLFRNHPIPANTSAEQWAQLLQLFRDAHGFDSFVSADLPDFLE